MKLSLCVLALISVAASAHKAIRGETRKLMKKKGDKKKEKKSSSGDDDDDDDDEGEYYLAASIANYPGNDNGGIFGTVELHFKPDSSFLTKLDLIGIPAGCVDCGVHVHTGMSCEDTSTPGGHYWNSELFGDTDPWLLVSYDGTDDGTSTTHFFIDNGFALDENEGHTVVVHGQNKERIGCGVLQKMKRDPNDVLVVKVQDDVEKFLSASIDTYPGADVYIQGIVNLRFNPDGSFLTKLDLKGVLSSCTDCGIHVHAGMSCDDASAPGGHYWNTAKFGTEDPWNHVSYDGTYDGTSTTGFHINSGYGLDENEGHAVVVHTEGGERIGCGVLHKSNTEIDPYQSLKSKEIGIYPGYAGSLEPLGAVHVSNFQDGSMKFYYHMSGLAPGCYGCGVHIHAGLSCDDPSLVLGHYWDTSEQIEDPWVASFGSSYTSDGEGEAKGFFYLFSGYGFLDNSGHAVVFHDQEGTRIACGVLSPAAEGL